MRPAGLRRSSLVRRRRARRVTSPPLQLERVAAHHNVTTCVTGQVEIDRYLHQLALTEQSNGLAAVHVVVDPRSAADVLGFFTLSPVSVRLEKLTSAIPSLAGVRYPQVGGFLLGRVGVDTSHQGQGLGRALVARAADEARDMRSRVGGAYLAVDPKDARLVAFYEGMGFTRLDPNKVTTRMVLSLM